MFIYFKNLVAVFLIIVASIQGCAPTITLSKNMLPIATISNPSIQGLKPSISIQKFEGHHGFDSDIRHATHMEKYKTRFIQKVFRESGLFSEVTICNEDCDILISIIHRDLFDNPSGDELFLFSMFGFLIPFKLDYYHTVNADVMNNTGKVLGSYDYEDGEVDWAHVIFIPFTPWLSVIVHKRTEKNIYMNLLMDMQRDGLIVVNEDR